MNLFSRSLILLAAALALASSFSAASDSMDAAPERPEVTVAQIRGWQYPSSQEFPGIVSPGKRAILSTRIAGTLLSVEVDPGDMVQAGDLLATVDAREVHATIDAAHANITAAESAVQQARLDSQRLQRLYDEDLIARVRVERAEVNLLQLEAQLQEARSELEVRKANLSYARLTAPFTGLISETLADAGSFVGPGQALLVLESREQWRIDVPVSNRLAASLAPGQKIPVITGPGRSAVRAYLTGVIPSLEAGGTGQRLRLALTSDSEPLAPGQVVSVLISSPDDHRQKQDDGWVGLPEAALIRRGQLTGVLIVEQRGDLPAAIKLRWIRTAAPPADVADLVPVTQGLSAGEHVVLNPSAELQDGQSVTVKFAGTVDGQQ